MSFKSPWLYPLLACFLLAFLFAFRQNIDFDMGFHLRAGQWILQNHAFPQKDVFTYTVNQNDYIDLHWLYQVTCYLLYRLGGYAGISLFHLLLTLLAFALTVARMRLAHPPPWAYTLLLLPTLIATEIRFLDRPEILSWVLLVLTLLVLDLRLDHNRNFLYLLPLFQLLWVNIEGLFILGWVAMGAYLVTNWFNFKRFDRPLLKYTLASLTATFLNPYFLKGVAFPFVLFTRLQGASIFKHYISEFQSPWALAQDATLPFMPAWPIYTYRIFSLALLALIGLSYEKRKFHELFLVVAFFGLSVAAIRNCPLFFWIALPVAAAAVRDLLSSRPEAQAQSDRFSSLKSPAILAALLILLVGARVLTGAYFVSDRRVIHRGLGMDPGRFPIQAADYMAQNHLTAPLLNDLSYGGWLIWKGPSPVFIDGRLEVMQEGLFTQYRDSYYPGGLSALALRWNAPLVLFDHMMSTPWFTQLQSMPGWRLLYFDDVDALYARNDYRPDLKPIPWEDRLKEWGLGTPPSDSVVKDLAQQQRDPLADWLSGFFIPQDYPMPLFRLGAFAYENGRLDIARDFFLETLRRTSGRYFEVYFNLGVTYDHLEQKDLARICYEKTLELNPGYAAAAQKLDRL
jgi:tetratricopeptide (TPR) repeat protein